MLSKAKVRRLLGPLLLIGGGIGVGAWVGWRLSQTREVSPSLKEHQTLLIERLTTLGQLTVLRYVVRDVVQREWRYGVPFTSSELLLVVAGEADICIDFSQVRVQEARWERKAVTLRLPVPFLCQVRIDPTQSRVYAADFSVIEWWQGGEAERVRETLAAAQETLRVRIATSFPRAAAQAQAEKLLRSLCQEMGWQEVRFVYGER
ncbi:MAG: hypothetical protein KatS3mg025_0716 [Bacteroidia bacterium]|nr:MAG: hypothetical protein KatS3mg025_0716 [Bacteroidia bacterium]